MTVFSKKTKVKEVSHLYFIVLCFRAVLCIRAGSKADSNTMAKPGRGEAGGSPLLKIGARFTQYFAGFVFCFLVSTASHAENDRGFFWQASSDSTTIYLLGSIHFADKSFYPMRQTIREAFGKADNLVVELDVTAIDGQKYKQAVQAEGFYKNGDSIAAHVSADTLKLLRQVLNDYGIAYDQLKQQKPGMLVLSLTAIQAMKLGLDPNQGIDQYFIAHRKGKQLIELESIEQQLALFLGAPNGELLLQEALHSMADAEDYLHKILLYWKAGDANKMQALLFEDAVDDYPAFADIYEQLFYQRNRQMVKKIEALLATDKVSFVVVGAGHLIGDKSIIHLLKEQGYEITRL